MNDSEPSSATPDVSVLIANYNNQNFIAEAINSVLAQDGVGTEIIFVDDRSSDDSVAVVEDIRRRVGDRVRLIVQDARQGPAAARNRGLQEARGHWIAILDGDDLMEPGRLRTLIDRAVEAGADIVADDLMLFYEDGGQAPHRHLGERFAYDRSIGTARFIAENNFNSKQPTLGYLKPVIRTERLRAAGVLYNPTLGIGEDYDFMVRLLRAGLSFVVAPVAGYRYRRHSSSTSHRINGAHLEALLQADREFAQDLKPEDSDIAQALQRREQSILDSLAYDSLVNALKEGAIPRAMKILASRPHIAPFLGDPIAVRIDRIRALLHGKRSSGSAA